MANPGEAADCPSSLVLSHTHASHVSLLSPRPPTSAQPASASKDAPWPARRAQRAVAWFYVFTSHGWNARILRGGGVVRFRRPKMRYMAHPMAAEGSTESEKRLMNALLKMSVSADCRAFVRRFFGDGRGTACSTFSEVRAAIGRHQAHARALERSVLHSIIILHHGLVPARERWQSLSMFLRQGRHPRFS